jgi:hypothetical protein
MTDAELADHAWWGSFWTAIEHTAFVGLIVALAIEFLALKLAEPHKKAVEDAKDVKIADLNKETAQLRTQNALTVDSLLAAVRAGRHNALATEANRSTTEAMAVAQGFMMREATTEATRSLYIGSKVTPFASKKFDAVVTSTAIDIGALLGALRNALKNAGWIEIERSDPTAGVGLLLMDKGGGPALVRIDVDASKDSELLDAANALASALNAEGIAATVNPTTEAETNDANVIHILIGPKP